MKKTEKDVVEEVIDEEKPTRKKKAKNEEVEEKKSSKKKEEKLKETNNKKDKKEETKKDKASKENDKKSGEEDTEKEKLLKIVNAAKEKGKITYGELAAELGEANPEQIDKVFEAFEEIGVNVLKDDEDFLEPDIDDLDEVEDIKLEDIDLVNIEGVSVDDPVRMYLREIGRILLENDQL